MLSLLCSQLHTFVEFCVSDACIWFMHSVMICNLYRYSCWTCKHPLEIYHAFLLLRCILNFNFLQHHCYCQAE